MDLKIKELLLVFLIVVTGCQENRVNYIKLTGGVFGTSYMVNYKGKQNYKVQIDSLFNEFNASLSTYIPTSAISKINKKDSLVVVDAYFEEIMSKSKRIFKETDGYFDPTVGDLVNAWGFGPEKAKRDLDSAEVAGLMQSVGFDKVALVNRKIRKEAAAVYLDFNSIAKGYGVDVVGRFLERKGVENYLIEIGGEIRTRGDNKKGEKWTIGVDNPNTDGTRSITDFIKLSDESMASSGNYRKFRVSKEGKKYVHTVNPKTGFAEENDLLSATVYGAIDCADLDAYATAFMAMGFEKTKAFLEKNPDIKAILVYINKEGVVARFKC
ncbi:Thiamine biosynthesis lipoprotein ApbE [Tenacibaculum maritimum]|uniref:FAD:protein FMN transferase n=1 Tax=Tenacibaculum maritimum TaxID=107401 RepID=UPI0012E60B57|nr:FAD:protein FMN transferase [Tenacibaculum maritimum]CAA0161460.1 Thiamine biosynthesis lipoprotein ApbE [Tenacibaculum maritimum]CAA0174916.1 Thiamine biosynthesis lipoprotein ApbE [Tenacibaculum maritimum]CAA0200076.1 Thiamine biosynthesis lipoprotein ApbE [Tenacibaculum maritimum]